MKRGRCPVGRHRDNGLSLRLSRSESFAWTHALPFAWLQQASYGCLCRYNCVSLCAGQRKALASQGERVSSSGDEGCREGSSAKQAVHHKNEGSSRYSPLQKAGGWRGNLLASPLVKAMERALAMEGALVMEEPLVMEGPLVMKGALMMEGALVLTTAKPSCTEKAVHP